ncbi:unnamed protein product [Pedinophyceae sp. YPF-701]|nr:unnamed protein product [Pedinophyceae sp. YPF-701]
MPSAKDGDNSMRGGNSQGSLNLVAHQTKPGTMHSIHGSEAARRQAITELLFFASVGDSIRCQRIVEAFTLDVSSDTCCDYDKRTPLHLAASEGCYSVAKWLLSKGANVNAVDRFGRTPLADAVMADHGEVAKLLMTKGGKVVDKDSTDIKLVQLEDHQMAGRVKWDDISDWEVDPKTIKMLRKLGQGEFGEVYLAEWHGTLIAVKKLRDSNEVALGDFRTELNILMKVHHPHMVQFLGAVTKTEPFMILTEFMPGGSLADLFALRKPISARRSAEIALDTARGMSYLHNRSPQAVIHRDLKPANLMVSGNPYRGANQEGFRERLMFDTGIIKVADFGLSKSLVLNKNKNKHGNVQLSDLQEDDTYQMTGETGSYRYMAPEVFRHEPYNNKVDIYAYAMIMYQLFEGAPPFHNMDPIDAAKAACLEGKRPMFSNPNYWDGVAPKPLRDLIARCWNENPDARPEFNEIVEILQAYLESLGPAPKIYKPVEEPPKNCCTLQ